jgi:Mrp family chromosome partitioning ATPase
MEDWLKLVLTGDPRIVTGVVLGGFAGISAGYTVGKVFGNWTLNRKLATAEAQLKDLKATVDDSVFLWLRKPYQRPSDYVSIVNNSIPIISIVNLKGGVGKTTIAANLVAFLAEQRRRDGSPLNILVIDLDYQGSLSSMLYTAAGLELHETKSQFLVDPTKSVELAKASVTCLRPKFENVHLYASFEDFLETENRLMME